MLHKHLAAFFAANMGYLFKYYTVSIPARTKGVRRKGKIMREIEEQRSKRESEAGG